MINNFDWSAKDKTWYGSIGDGEAIASKLDELRQTMPKEQIFTLQSIQSMQDTLRYQMKKGFIYGSAAIGGGVLAGVIVRCLGSCLMDKHQEKKDQKKG